MCCIYIMAVFTLWKYSFVFIWEPWALAKSHLAGKLSFCLQKQKALCTLKATESSLLGSCANTFCWQALYSSHAVLQWLNELCSQISFFFSGTELTVDSSGDTTCFTCSWKKKRKTNLALCSWSTLTLILLPFMVQFLILVFWWVCEWIWVFLLF